MDNMYDVIIIGGGPAGLSAALYSARAKMTTLVIEKEKEGGQITNTQEVANYPGSIENATGNSLSNRMVEQCKEFGVKIQRDNVVEAKLDGDIKEIVGEQQTYKAKSVIIATGASPRLLNCPGEKDFTGRGVSYCATCDADFFTDLEILVIGGGDSAVEEAIHLTKFGRKVTIVHRRDELRAAKSIQDKAFNNPKINFIWDSAVEEIKGEGFVQSIKLKNLKTGEVTEYKADENDGTFGIFVFVGYLPETQLFKGVVNMDESNYIITDENMKTNIEGVFAAGDCRVKSLRQVVTAVGDGAIAATQAEKYIENKFN
ncbi:thioredoxin-disulfide reductase [Serpentinicella alkaliphila]|uniref:Thioredoxin reductase n=1 Tax=Serpentinicella alkaliphila TaxID=1734049 RepID=A0A4R2TIP3_9FIRM|nr:thioredoxin-disulfide reductase [Serpentinicella alkaliphila]QUH25990.1 thioredoxin-disulfide reductase [Serpentinicella alkaliphila]TCQ02152.1 thioredoxin reductase (NADPH) [Serpentinicella alkaliphila]